MANIHLLGRRESSSSAQSDRVSKAVRSVLRDLFGPPAQRRFAIRLWDGTTEAAGAAQAQPPLFTLVLRRPSAVRRMLLPPSEISLGEAYLRDDYDIEGNMEAATALADSIADRLRSPAMLAHLTTTLLEIPGGEHETSVTTGQRASHLHGKQHSQRRDAAAVRYHYDVGNDFYSLWLDKRMVYSCAYFQTGTEDIDTAQTAKLEHICRKLRLQPGERLLDIGCGWGGLVIYAAAHYGVDATGITLSAPQAELARKRIKEAGLSDKCRVEVRDYRDMPHDHAFDKVVSVGMVEHVGKAKLPVYFDQAYRLTRPGGLFLNHGIVMTTPAHPSLTGWATRKIWREGEFIERYVFPDGELVTPGENINFAEKAGFETRDVESLREHYALTLRHWVHRLEAHHEEAVKLVGEPTYRVWRMYMAGSAHGFASGRVGIIQTLLSRQSKGGSSHLPLTRADIYKRDAKINKQTEAA